MYNVFFQEMMKQHVTGYNVFFKEQNIGKFYTCLILSDSGLVKRFPDFYPPGVLRGGYE